MHIRKSLLITIALYCTAAYGQDSSNRLASVFNNQGKEIASFTDNVLRQFPSEVITELAQAIQKESTGAIDDAQFYEKLCTRLKPLRSRLDIFRIIKLVRFQKNLLKQQILTLLGGKPVVNHCLEIGTPANYASTIRDQIKGDIHVLTEKALATDALQAHSLNPLNGFKGYNQHTALNNYEPISSSIPDNHFDLIICTIGLHHVPPGKLPAFIDSIKRVLRPGGIFLLREHNAYTPELVSLAYAAHSVFNAIIPQETTAADVQEIRNFHALEYWKNTLEHHGFSIGSEELLQDYDTTLNTFIKCTKKCVTPKDLIINASAQALQHADYSRDSVQTYLTTPEWNNVDSAQQYGTYINKIPFYEFPYMAHVATFWKTFFASWHCAAQAKGGNIPMLLSPNIVFNYALMNVFIGTFMTVEYTAKAIVSWPIRAMLSGVEATTLLALVHDPLNEIASDPSIIVKENYDGSIKLVSIPRYLEFLSSIKKLMNSSVTFIKIANNEHILCKIRYTKDIEAKPSWIQKFTWKMPTIPDYTYAAYYVPVHELKEFITVLHAPESELLYIHDF